MPVVAIRAVDLDITGYETPAELDDNETLKARLESIRLQAGPRMQLGDVTDKTVPKMCLMSPATRGGLVNTRTFIPHVCHQTIGVLGAISAGPPPVSCQSLLWRGLSARWQGALWMCLSNTRKVGLPFD